MTLDDVQISLLQDAASFRGLPPIDFAQVDFSQPGKGEHWWRLWGVAAELSGLFPTYLSPEFLNDMHITPINYVPEGCVPIRMYGGEWGLYDYWEDTSRLLFPDTLLEYAATPGATGLTQVYGPGCHTNECINPDTCKLDCVAHEAWVHLGLPEQQAYQL